MITVSFGNHEIDIEPLFAEVIKQLKTFKAERAFELVKDVAIVVQEGGTGRELRRRTIGQEEFLTAKGLRDAVGSYDDLIGAVSLKLYKIGHRRNFDRLNADSVRIFHRNRTVRLVVLSGVSCPIAMAKADAICEWPDAPKLPLKGCSNRALCPCGYQLHGR